MVVVGLEIKKANEANFEQDMEQPGGRDVSRTWTKNTILVSRNTARALSESLIRCREASKAAKLLSACSMLCPQSLTLC